MVVEIGGIGTQIETADSRAGNLLKALATLDRPLADGRLSARGLDRVVRVAWTLTDLTGKERPTADEINQALGLWEGRT